MTLEKPVSPPAVISNNNTIPNLLLAERKVYLSVRSHRQLGRSYSKPEVNGSALIRTTSLNTSTPEKLHSHLLRSHSHTCASLTSVPEGKHLPSTPVLNCSHTGVGPRPPGVVVVRASQVHSWHSPPHTCPRNNRLHEIAPPMPRSGGQSSRLSAFKRSEIKEQNSDGNSRILRPESSVSDINADSVKERQTRSADGRPRSSPTTCSFFHFIRRKKKSSRTPSPDSRDLKSYPQNNRTRWSISCSSAQSAKRSERTHSPPPKDRRPSGQSQTSSRLPLTPLSSNPSLSITSPKIPLLDSTSSPVSKKRPQYTSRSRPKHRRDRRRHRTSKRATRTHPEDSLKLEDLPPHPSLFRKTIVKISSEPDTEYLIPSARSHRTEHSNRTENSNKTENSNRTEHSNRTENSNDNSSVSKFISGYSDTNSRSRKNSKAESSVNVKSVATSSGSGHRKESQTEDFAQNLKPKSQHSASKTDIEEESHCLTTSSLDARSRHFRSLSLPSFRGDQQQTDADTRVISDADDFEYSPSEMRGPLNLSLCGCGFLGMYHLGVVSCLALRGPSLVDRLEKIAGASAGALMAAVLVTARDKIEESAEHIQNLAKEIRKKPLGALTPGYNFTRSLRYMVEDILPEDAHEIARGKLFVSVTNADTRDNELMSDFESRDELIDALVASCYIPVYAGIKLPMLRGQKYIDGGLSDNMPKFETGRTITVSPFDGKSDIGPKHGQEIEKKAHFINVHNQDMQMLQEYFERGRRDASRFLIREGLYEVTQPPPKRPVLYESSV